MADNSKKLLAFSCSPRDEKGATDLVLGAFLKGWKDGGGKAAVLHPYRMNIAPCRGCFHCWTRGNGKCVIDDDMRDVLGAIERADALAFATPVYHFTMSEGMKRLLERTMPLMDPVVRWDAHGRANHARLGRHDQKTYLVSVCGFPEMEVFEPLRITFRRICQMMDWQLSGEILRTMSGLLFSKDCQIISSAYLKLVRTAGRMAAQTGSFAGSNEELDKPLVPAEDYYRIVNEFWKKRGT